MKSTNLIFIIRPYFGSSFKINSKLIDMTTLLLLLITLIAFILPFNSPLSLAEDNITSEESVLDQINRSSQTTSLTPKLHHIRPFESRTKPQQSHQQQQQQQQQQRPKKPKQTARVGPKQATNGSRKLNEETLSEDCLERRNQLLHKLNQSNDRNKPWPDHDYSIPSSYQRLKPLLGETNTSFTSQVNSENDFNSHIPQCNKNGHYEPVQCHKVGYCWCVNKFGQAIKNSASHIGQKPQCNSTIYEFPIDGNQLIMPVTESSVRNFFREQTTPTPDAVHFGHSERDLDSSGVFGIQNDRNNPEKRADSYQEPVLSLIPNDCNLSRDNAKERAKNSSIYGDVWIPDCDPMERRLYAAKQCHRSKICWCVDQNTGLPLRTPELLSKELNINCTEIRKIIGLPSPAINSYDQEHEQIKPSYASFKAQCDFDQRYQFLQSLMSQYKTRITYELRINSKPIELDGVTISNANKLTGEQIFRWAFSLIDTDSNGMLDDREWHRFSGNFNIVNQMEDPIHHYRKVNWAMIKLNIIKGQKRCWRAFLDFCSNGDLLADSSVSLTLEKWLSCTELPQQKIIHAYSREAALKRTQSRNPMLNFKPE